MEPIKKAILTSVLCAIIIVIAIADRIVNDSTYLAPVAMVAVIIGVISSSFIIETRRKIK